MGVPPAHVMAVAETVMTHSRSIAKAFVRMFVRDMMGSEEPGDISASDWNELRAALGRLSPLAGQVTQAAFQIAMGEAVERQVHRSLKD